MTTTILYKYLVYVIALAIIFTWFFLAKLRKRLTSISILKHAQRDGLTEPSSLHPVIDPIRCIGCEACTFACPEKGVLGIIGGKAHLISPTSCIGHGACREACPVDAITLVFGTEKRGVDIPFVNPDFGTNVPGIFIAGELGGMGLIRNAVEQGRQAMESICRLDGLGRRDRLDVLIVGAGPAGFSASLAALYHKLRFVTVEQDTLGGTVAHYPRGKIVMTTPVNLPLMGKMDFTETTKEALLNFWQNVEKQAGVKHNYQERLESIAAHGDSFDVKTSRRTYRTRAVLLAIGRRGTPRKLGVPGENLPKVVYRVVDPEQYRGKRVLVVGGGDSALEAATSIASQPDTRVILSYRGDAFSRAKAKNRQKVMESVATGQLHVLMKSHLEAIGEHSVRMQLAGVTQDIENDAVVVSAGGILATELLKKIGIRIETKYGTV